MTRNKTGLRPSIRRFTRVFGALSASLIGALPAFAAPTPVKFTLDWTIIGLHAPFTAAKQDGFFEKNGLDVKIDRGYGSGDTISKVGNGVYDFGYADGNLLLKWNNDNPNAKVTLVFLVYDGTQSAVMTTAATGIKTPKQLEGRKVGGPPSDNTRMLFPVYAKAAGIDGSKIDWVSAAPNLTNPMLHNRQVDAITSQEPTTFLALTKFGEKPSDVVALRYNAYLPELLGSGIIVSQKTLKARPDLVKAFVRAVIEGEEQAIAHPADAIQTLKSLDPLTDIASERTRLDMTFDMAMQNPLLKSDGLGAVDPQRLSKAMQDMSEAFGAPVPTDLSTIYDASFLPPKSERLYSGYAAAK